MTGRELVTKYITEGGIYCLTAEKFSKGRSNVEVVRAMLNAGIKIVQYREKNTKGGAMLTECREIRAMTREAGAAFIINDHIDLALLVEADGVHIGQEDYPVSEVRKLVGEDMAIGLSTHSPDEARAAIAAGADNIGVGPIFATQTKEDVCAPVGLEYLEFVTANIDLPFVCIGGIKEHNIGDVVTRGGKCIAMVTEIVEADDIGGMIARLNKAMGR